MKRIYKYKLPYDGEVTMPARANPVSVGVVAEEVYVWAEVGDGGDSEVKRFGVYGTGHDMPDDPGRFLGTVQLMGGSLIFHIYTH